MLQKGEQWADDVVEITQSVWDNTVFLDKPQFNQDCNARLNSAVT